MGASTSVDRTAVLGALARVVDPELGADLVSLGMIGEITVDDGVVTVPVMLTTAGCPLKSQIRGDVVSKVTGVHGVRHVRVVFEELSGPARSLVIDRWRASMSRSGPPVDVPPTLRVIVVLPGSAVAAYGVADEVAGTLAARGFSVVHVAAASPGVRASVSRAGPSGPGRMTLEPLQVPSTDGGTCLAAGTVAAFASSFASSDWVGVDYAVVELPAASGALYPVLASAFPTADVVVVSCDEPAAASSAERVGEALCASRVRLIGLVSLSGGDVCTASVATRLGVPLLAEVPADHGGTRRTESLEHLCTVISEQAAPPVDASSCTARLTRGLLR